MRGRPGTFEYLGFLGAYAENRGGVLKLGEAVDAATRMGLVPSRRAGYSRLSVTIGRHPTLFRWRDRGVYEWRGRTGKAA